MKLHVLGIDLGKTVFHLVGLDLTGRVVIRKRCSRRQLLAFTANLEVQLIGMEACSGAHLLGRALREQGHEVRLMPAQYMKPYVQTNKSDYLNAEAIAEDVQRPRMRFVPIKTEEQLDLQALHRVRERWVMRRTAVVNQTGGKQKLLGISKRGNKYLRRLFVQGARSVLQQRHKQAPALSSWIAQLLKRTHQNVVVVALANKLVRMAWAVLCKNQRYPTPVLAVSA
jgi:transposase